MFSSQRPVRATEAIPLGNSGIHRKTCTSASTHLRAEAAGVYTAILISHWGRTVPGTRGGEDVNFSRLPVWWRRFW